MAGVEGMAFAPDGLPSANKERRFCWDGLNDGMGGDFFDQFVELGDSDSESIAGGGGGLGHLYGTSDLSMSPRLAGQMPPNDRGIPIPGAVSRPQGISGSAPSSGSLYSAARVARPRMHPAYRGTSDMINYDAPGTGFDDMYSTSFSETLAGGSISDSELLKLEGLTMRSPRIQIPQPSASVPASPPSQATSPRKASRLEAFCSRIRNKAATFHGKSHEGETKLEPASPAARAAPLMSTAQMEPVRGRHRPHDLQLCREQLPLSPPPTGVMSGHPQRPFAGSHNNTSDAAFINGLLDDPFIPGGLLGGQFAPPLQLNGGAMPQTPLETPLADGMPAWQLPMSTATSKPQWAPAPSPYFPAADNWWDPSADAMDTDPTPLDLSYHTTANARNASMNLAIQLHQQQSFEYPPPPGTGDLAAGGLMIHMPQPRGVPSAVLHGDRPTRADHHHRRPKPRAPSSGARHHQYGPGVSPRKTRAAAGSASASASGRGSVSPSPKAPPARGHRATSSSTLSAAGSHPTTTRRLHRRSASMQKGPGSWGVWFNGGGGAQRR
ncbi:hypothetical protein BT67DRAFT_436368 [Trichocladium antarcticum]|uniref:Developmental regulatory protein wetA n=1 Tax=Trichocladium antarcticum TaxID=1450529 RepID=A0AAN6UEW5_9PEZI|nr:hypothetical protein BT67DRAFT_436368 [Trichocladium antarcticum]